MIVKVSLSKFAAVAAAASMLVLGAWSGIAAAQSADGPNVAAIKERGKLVIATSGTFRPLTFMNDKGELDGYDRDWGELIADSLGVEAEFVQGPLDGLVPGLVADKYDIVLSGLVVTEDRKKVIDFSQPYAISGAVAVVRGDNTTVKDVKELDGLSVGVIAGSGYVENVKEIGGYAVLNEYPGAPEAYLDLKAGRIDVFVAGNIGVADFIKHDQSANPLKMVGTEYKKVYSAVGIRKGEDDLKAAIDQLLTDKKADGTFADISNKWFGFVMAE